MFLNVDFLQDFVCLNDIYEAPNVLMTDMPHLLKYIASAIEISLKNKFKKDLCYGK